MAVKMTFVHIKMILGKFKLFCYFFEWICVGRVEISKVKLFPKLEIGW